MKTQATKLTTAIANLACDAVRIQERLDEAHGHAEGELVRTLAAVPEAARQLLLPLAPLHRVIESHRIRCTIQAGMALDARGGVMIAPVRLGMSAAYGERRQATSTLEVLVIRQPTRAAPGPAGAQPLERQPSSD